MVWVKLTAHVVLVVAGVTTTVALVEALENSPVVLPGGSGQT
jgi:hypothetical protein